MWSSWSLPYVKDWVGVSGPEPRLLVLPVVHLHVAAATARPHQEALLPAHNNQGFKGTVSRARLGFWWHKWIDLGLMNVAPGFCFYFFTCPSEFTKKFYTFLPVDASLRWLNNRCVFLSVFTYQHQGDRIKFLMLYTSLGVYFLKNFFSSFFVHRGCEANGL